MMVAGDVHINLVSASHYQLRECFNTVKRVRVAAGYAYALDIYYYFKA